MKFRRRRRKASRGSSEHTGPLCSRAGRGESSIVKPNASSKTIASRVGCFGDHGLIALTSWHASIAVPMSPETFIYFAGCATK